MKGAPPWTVAVPAVSAAAGLLFVASAFTADGTDLRSTTTDLSTLVADRAEEVAELRAEIEQLEAERAAGRGPVVRPGAMPSSWRFDKQRRAEWERAAAYGREEQLRIERWMERTGGRR